MYIYMAFLFGWICLCVWFFVFLHKLSRLWYLYVNVICISKYIWSINKIVFRIDTTFQWSAHNYIAVCYQQETLTAITANKKLPISIPLEFYFLTINTDTTIEYNIHNMVLNLIIWRKVFVYEIVYIPYYFDRLLWSDTICGISIQVTHATQYTLLLVLR